MVSCGRGCRRRRCRVALDASQCITFCATCHEVETRDALTRVCAACYTARHRVGLRSGMRRAADQVLGGSGDDARMRILTVSDKVEPVLYGPYIRERVGQDRPCPGVWRPAVLLSGVHRRAAGCAAVLRSWQPRQGDSAAVPRRRRRAWSPGASGWAENLHLRTVGHEGLLLAGLEGCRMYNPGAPFQYTEGDVRRQTFFLGRRLLTEPAAIRALPGHSDHPCAAAGIHDGEDLPHQGFESYLGFLRRYQPLLMIHGHQHVYNRNEVSETDY